MKFKVWVKWTANVTVNVEADTVEEAIHQVELGGGEMSNGSIDWYDYPEGIEEVYRVMEDGGIEPVEGSYGWRPNP